MVSCDVEYVGCLSGELEYKRYSLEKIEDLIWLINFMQVTDGYNKITVKKYENLRYDCDTCIDCLGRDILTITK